jgi:hypothetical protein
MNSTIIKKILNGLFRRFSKEKTDDIVDLFRPEFAIGICCKGLRERTEDATFHRCLDWKKGSNISPVISLRLETYLQRARVSVGFP